MFKSLPNKCHLVCTAKPGKELRYPSTVCTRFIPISSELASTIFVCSKESSHLPSDSKDAFAQVLRTGNKFFFICASYIKIFY